MLDGLLGRSGFSSKCKSLIKPTRTRIEVLRRRAEAKQKFLKEDLAKLLANGLDVNAYGRTEDFIAGLNLLSCYNFIDQSCEYILKQLSVMQKLGQCPEECRETVASLMFAAARFSDLPELRDLRDVFQDRYGNGLECYVNQVFVEKLASKPPVVEKRIKLLQDIAAEFSIQWDSKGFKQRMDKSSTVVQDQAMKLGPSSVNDDKFRVQNGNNVFRKNEPRSKERKEHNKLQDQAQNFGSLNVNDDKYRVPNGNTVHRKNDQHYRERMEDTHNGPPLYDNGNVNFRRQVSDIPFVRREEKHSKQTTNHVRGGPTLVERQEKHGHKHDGYLSKPRPESDSANNGIGNNHMTIPSSSSYHDRKERHTRIPEVNGDFQKSTGKLQEEEPIRLLKPPPYIKSNVPPPYTKPNNHHQPPVPPPSHNLPPENPSRRNKEHEQEQEQEHRRYQNDIPIPLPKPRSVRRKHSKSSSGHDDVGSSEDSRIVKRISSSRRKERKGLQILFDDEHYYRKDDEEKMMDKLLLHYSKKPSSYDGKLKKKKSRSNASNASKSPVDDDVEAVVTPVRSISLPHESEPKKVYARANSFQPDNQAAHVHPKLPDYDDLAARFAALRGR